MSKEGLVAEREQRTKLPPCFQPRVYVCPRPECHYIGSAAEKWGWKDGESICFGCGHPVDEKDIHVLTQQDEPTVPVDNADESNLASEEEQRKKSAENLDSPVPVEGDGGQSAPAPKADMAKRRRRPFGPPLDHNPQG